MPLFTHFIAVDWSAASRPTTGKNSLWLAEAGGLCGNLSTRAKMMAHLRARIEQALRNGERLLIGFDFAFGYPAGMVQAVTGQAGWRALWQYMASEVNDQPNNDNNRFAVAAQMNATIGLNEGPFWGHPNGQVYEGLAPTKPRDQTPSFPERRIVESRAKGAKSVFQLAYNGAVGNQSV